MLATKTHRAMPYIQEPPTSISILCTRKGGQHPSFSALKSPGGPRNFSLTYPERVLGAASGVRLPEHLPPKKGAVPVRGLTLSPFLILITEYAAYRVSHLPFKQPPRPHPV